MKIAFTTLACPDWTWEKIVEETSRLGFDGIELRGLEGEMFLPRCKPFLPENIQNTIDSLQYKGLEICCLDTSCVFHDPARFDSSIEEGKATIDLAHKLNVPYIRVFGDAIPDPSEKEQTIARVAEGLETLGQYAEGKGVQVLIETHGHFSDSENLLSVLQKTKSKAVGVLWDTNNPLKYGNGESLMHTYDKLSQYIMHTHIKDTNGWGTEERICLVGEGDMPVAECLDILKNNGYTGWLSFEWEKKWHPEIEGPEIALPAFISYIREISKGEF